MSDEQKLPDNSTADATAWAKAHEAEKNADSVEWDIDANRPAQPYPAEIIPMESELEQDLGHLLNRHSAENESGTPDFILAMFLKAQLDLFNQTINNRAAWRGESVELSALQQLRRDSEMTKKAAAYFKQLVEAGVIQVHTPLEATDIYREIMDMQYPPNPQDLEQGGLEAGDTQGPDDDPAEDAKEVPLVTYSDGQRNEIGTANVKVTPGEALVAGKTVIGAVAIFAEPKDDPDYPLQEPKDEPRPTGRFARYQQEGLSS